jgi:hypothetical protein
MWKYISQTGHRWESNAALVPCMRDNKDKNTDINAGYWILISSSLNNFAWSRKMFTATSRNREEAQLLICHYHLYSQILRLNKAMSKLFFCFSAASGTLHEDLCAFYSCRRHIWPYNIASWHTIFLYSWHWCVSQKHMQNALWFFLGNKC